MMTLRRAPALLRYLAAALLFFVHLAGVAAAPGGWLTSMDRAQFEADQAQRRQGRVVVAFLRFIEQVPELKGWALPDPESRAMIVGQTLLGYNRALEPEAFWQAMGEAARAIDGLRAERVALMENQGGPYRAAAVEQQLRLNTEELLRSYAQAFALNYGTVNSGKKADRAVRVMLLKVYGIMGIAGWAGWQLAHYLPGSNSVADVTCGAVAAICTMPLTILLMRRDTKRAERRTMELPLEEALRRAIPRVRVGCDEALVPADEEQEQMSEKTHVVTQGQL